MINTILCGDCLELLPDIPDNYVDMVFADLPYGDKTTSLAWDNHIPLEPLWAQLKRIAKKNAAMIFTASQPFTSMLVMSNPKQFKYEWIWCKGKGTGFQIVRYRPLVSHESILVFGQETVKYYPQMREREKPRTSKFSGSTRQAVISQGKPYVGDRPLEQRYPITELYITNNNQKEKRHPTQKPLALLEYLIRTYTDEGDIVLDPVCGSGTTAVACVKLNRNYIVMDKEQEYCDVTRSRIDGELFDGTKVDGWGK